MVSLPMEYYPTLGKKETLPYTATGMDLGNIQISEISQADKHHTIPVTPEF